ncbi:HsdR family type I site-specific deoxyribonuclease [Cellulomonas sp. NTE-D12]|uniref:type I restriction endonuclease subunit R n=1 Tax=Cellulomonas sp. NTE-D12 TaxID=2962632 RepID=UPI003081BDD8|nr:DEAD/DEAH box helicase [Cellulomonas sp. NTE-D12]
MVGGVPEKQFQNTLIDWSIPLGWKYVAGRELPRERTQTVVVPYLRDAVVRLNVRVIDDFDVDAIVDAVVASVSKVEGGLVASNERVLKLLRGGIEARNRDDELHTLRLVDFDKWGANSLVVSDEVSIAVSGATTRRFDLVYYVNGLPVVVVETKSPTANSSWADAATEINNVYAAEYTWFFTPNVFCVASDGVKLRFGAALAPVNKWQPFRSTADDEALSGMADVARSVQLLLAPANVLDILANFCLFDTAGDGVDIKYLPRYPQKEAAHLIHDRVVSGGDCGLIWHHQGSGKTLLMIFAASLLLNDTRTASPTIILLSDRTQLVRQTSGVFVSALGNQFFHKPETSAELRALLATGVRGVISTTVHKFAEAGQSLSVRSNIVVMVDEAHRTQSAKTESLAGQMRSALPNAKFFGMTGTPVANLNTDTFALFGDPSDPKRVLHYYGATRSLADEATVPVLFEPHPVKFETDTNGLEDEFGKFAEANELDDVDKETLSRKFGRLTSLFSNPERVEEVCQDIVDHYLATAYRNEMKAQVVAYNRELAVAYTNKINEILAGYGAQQILAEVGRHEAIAAEVNVSVSDSKDEDPAMRRHHMTEAVEEDQKRRFLTPDDPLCFLVVTAKLLTGFDAPNEGVLYLDKPLTKHTLYQTITRPNRTWVSPSGFVKTQGAVVDYIGLAEQVQGAVIDPAFDGTGPKKSFITGMSELVIGFRTTIDRIEDVLVEGGVDIHGDDGALARFAALSAINTFLDEHPDAAEEFKKDYRLLAKLYPYVSKDARVARYDDTFALFGAVYVTLFKQSTDEERRHRLAELGPQVLAIINTHVHDFEVASAQGEALLLDQQGFMILRELMVTITPDVPVDTDAQPPSAKEILDRIKDALDHGVDERSVKYVALAERIRALRERVIRNAVDTLEFLTEALQIAKSIVQAQQSKDEPLVADADHIGVLTRIITEHQPKGMTVTARHLAEEIDQVVKRTLARSWDNTEDRGRGVRRAAAAVFRKYLLRPVGEPFDSTVAYIEAHYLLD